MQSNLFFIFLLFISVGLNTLGQTLLKLGSGQNFFNLYSIGGLGTLGLSVVFYTKALVKFDLSVAYPTMIGLTVIGTTFVGTVLLKEKVFFTHWLGIGLMLSGISAIALSQTNQ